VKPRQAAVFRDKEATVAQNNGFAYLAVAIGAAAVGAAVGVLMAPAAGRETRRKLGRRIEKETEHLKKQGARALKDFGERAAETFEDGKHRLTELLS
jgi:gas vesicle protein